MKSNVCSIALMSVLLVGCASVGPTGGGIYHNIKYGVDATPAKEATKKGEACQTSVLGLVASGDASIDTAKKNGSITEVSSVDASSTSVLFFYNTFCTIVTGK